MSNLFGGTCTVIAVLGQKGGIAKSTSAINLATYLALAGKKVMFLDADPQGDATKHLWATMPPEIAAQDPMQIKPTFNELLTDPTLSVQEVIYTNSFGLMLIPANHRLDDTDNSITPPQVRGLLPPIMQELVPMADYIVIDTRRSGSRLTKSVIRIADQVLLPMQAEFLSLENIDPTMADVEEMRKLNPMIDVLGILPTMVARTRVSRSVQEEVREAVIEAEKRLGIKQGLYSDRILPILIMRSTKYPESSGARLPIQLYMDLLTKGWSAERRAKEMESLQGYSQLAQYVLNGKVE